MVVLLGTGIPRHVQAAPRHPAIHGALQRAFQLAAREYGVPEAVLLAVSYNLTRWDEHPGVPSFSGGYGPMYLTHVTSTASRDRGDPDRGVRSTISPDPSLHTLDAAARLLRLPILTLERVPSENIRGGAALLARYARLSLGRSPKTVGEWYGAVAALSGARDSGTARSFANEVYATMRSGAIRYTAERQIVRLRPEPVMADTRTLHTLHLRPDAAPVADCPVGLSCTYVPAAYRVNSSDPTDYGNYDAANRGRDGLDIRYIVIHDTESPYASAVNTFQDPHRYASANYVIRSSDGRITQMVRNTNVAWHAGNYYVNMHAIGIEHEGVAVQGATWYGEQLYQASAQLVRYLAARYHVPLDRAHIIGHDEVPGPTPATQSSQHWDPGPFWDWQHYMDLLGAPIPSAGTRVAPPGSTVADPASQAGGKPAGADHNPVHAILTLAPDFATNQPSLRYCFSTGDCRTLPAQSANFVPLRTAPAPDAPLFGDPALYAPSAGTKQANDWGDKGATGQQYYREAEQGAWDAIDYAGRLAWFYNPRHSSMTATGSGQVVTPRDGLQSIPVYGWAAPESAAYPHGVPVQHLLPLQYAIPAGQSYVAIGPVQSDYYWSPTQTHHVVVRGATRYYQISFNHRFAFVRASDVTVRQVGL